MSGTEGELIFYGLDNFDEKLNYILDNLNLEKDSFEIKLIIVEAINNAFIHGNNGDESKSISLSWQLTDCLLNIEVTDCGNGFEELETYKNIDENDILSESGRGLYIISCYSDEMKFNGSTISIKKHIQQENWTT